MCRAIRSVFAALRGLFAEGALSNLKSALDVSFANVNLADGRLLLAQAQNELKSGEAQLAAAMGLPSETTSPSRRNHSQSSCRTRSIL